MESIAPDFVTRVVLIRNAIQVGSGWDRVVEGRIEYRHVRGLRKQLPARVIAPEVVRIVQRRKLATAFDQADDFGIHYNRVLEKIRSVNDAVAYGFDLFEPRDARFREAFESGGQRGVVGWDRAGLLDFVPAGGLERDLPIPISDPADLAPRDRAVPIRRA